MIRSGTIDDFTDEQENNNTRAKIDRHVILLKPFLQRKLELLKKYLLLKSMNSRAISYSPLEPKMEIVNDYEPTSRQRKRLPVLSSNFDED